MLFGVFTRRDVDGYRADCIAVIVKAGIDILFGSFEVRARGLLVCSLAV